MSNLPCFKADDVRGEIGANIDEDIAYRVGRAVALHFGAKSVVIEFDAREASPTFATAASHGARDAGADADLTVLPATVHRPWGTYAMLKQEDGCQVKRISVAPGRKLSLQYHHKRAEHWVVTQGKAMVQLGGEEFETGPGEYRYIPLGEKHRLTNVGDTELVTKGKAIVQIGDEELETGPGEYRYIPLGEKHRLTNVGETELVLIEVQAGSYLGEDDIVRVEDIYGRE